MTIEERIAENNHPPVQVTDEHIQKLQVEKDSILLVRVPIELAQAEGKAILETIQQVIHKKTGHNPGILMVARDCDLSLLDIEALEMLRAEIDATFQYRFRHFGGNAGN